MPRPRAPRGFDERAPTTLPDLSGRDPGSVTRALAEAFAKEYAALQAQMEAVHDSAFVDTAAGADLDALAKLLRLHRRRVESLHVEAKALLKKKPKKKNARSGGPAKRGRSGSAKRPT